MQLYDGFIVSCLKKFLAGEGEPHGVIRGELYGDDTLFPDIGDKEEILLLTQVKREHGKITRRAQRKHWKFNRSENHETSATTGRSYIKRYLTFEAPWISSTRDVIWRNINVVEYELLPPNHNTMPEGWIWVICLLKLGRKVRSREQHAVQYYVEEGLDQEQQVEQYYVGEDLGNVDALDFPIGTFTEDDEDNYLLNSRPLDDHEITSFESGDSVMSGLGPFF